MATDPGDKVPPNLLAHVHLVSTYAFSFHPSPLNLDTALSHLLNAPKIVGEHSPVNWQYVTPPRDGTIFLAWQPTKQMGTTCATDGYVWAEPERILMQENKGYKIEIFVYECGFVPGVEQVATHRRVRYRLVASSTGEPVNPNLEIIHYTRASQDQQMHHNQIPVTPQKQQLLTQRRYLEQVGALVRKDFHLHDRNNWPTVSMPSSRQPMVPNPYQSGGFPGGGFPQASRGPQHLMNPGAGMRPGVGPSPAKRPRQQAPPHIPRPPFPPQDDALLAEEDAPSLGDFLDQLSPREISFTRYTQHHEWMEEILSSSYAMRQITPVELGLGLAGELAGLTQDLFERKSVEAAIKGFTTGPDRPLEIAQDKVEELEKRIVKFEQDGREELAAAKAEHAQKMQKLSKQKSLVVLEKRLAEADMEANSGETINDIVREAEQTIGTKFAQRDEVVRVEKGGLLLGGEEAAAANGNAMNGHGDEFNEFTNLDSTADGFDFLSGGNDSNMTFDT